MASFEAIRLVAETIRQILLDDAAAVGTPTVRLQGTQDLRAANQPPGISIYLYRVAFNTNRRRQGPRLNAQGLRFRPPTPVDLHFLITVWANPDPLGGAAGAQMELLGWVIRTLQDHAELPAGLLNRAGTNGARAVFAAGESVELVGEILAPQEFVNIWGNTLPNQQPSISYVARQVLIDSEILMPDNPLVQSRNFDHARLSSDDRDLAATR